MKFLNLFGIRKKVRPKKRDLRFIICLFFILIFLLSFVYINDNSFKINPSEEIFSTNNYSNPDSTFNSLNSASSTSLLQDPFTKNFTLMHNFFEERYRTNLGFDISTYYRYGDSNGVITNGTIFSEDNLLYYNSLMKMEISDTETFDIYLDLKNTTLWYQGNVNEFKYGFVNSIDNITGEINNENRSLIDNILPIFLLIENIGDNIDSIFIGGKNPIYYINEMFYLINSSEFWDTRSNYNGFFHYNNSYTKYAESNFYSVLANLLIHRTSELDISIRDRAYEIANLTMIDMVNKEYMWDQDDQAFYYAANENWTKGFEQDFYHLSTNALGIITLLEFWIETGMTNSSIYFQNALNLYRKLDFLYDNGLYQNIAIAGWAGIDDPTKDLKANAMMMSACLKLFEVTGNITYHNRAMVIYDSIETYLYDNTNHVYDFTLTNNNKSFNSNLKLSEAYLDAFEIYSTTVLDAVYNVSGEIPNFIFNQDTINLTSVYSFQKNIPFFNPESGSYGISTIQCDITNSSFNYIFKYPNGTYFYQFEHQIVDPETYYIKLYNITDNLPIDDGYYIYLWANTTYFKLADTVKRFNVKSGLILESIEGLGGTLYQGPVINVSIVVNYTRSENLTLMASLEGVDIINYPSQEIDFSSSELTRISFNLTAIYGAPIGNSEIIFKIEKDNIIYLNIEEVIEIGYSFDYSNFFYQTRVVKGDTILVSMNLKNFLPNDSQYINLTFTGTSENVIESYITEEFLGKNQLKTVSYYLQTLESITNDTISIKMRILINATEYYSTTFSVDIIPKFEIISFSFPEKLSHGSNGYIIITIQNNLKYSEEFSLHINGIKSETNLAELNRGENRIVAKIKMSLNPYEFGSRKYIVELKDNANEDIALFYFEIALELTALNLVLFYILPIIIPIGIILFFKNKDIKHKKLRR
ncbi:MAG: hypothetical protein ACFE91_08420 [Promethearchaeota archaeon]